MSIQQMNKTIYYDGYKRFYKVKRIPRKIKKALKTSCDYFVACGVIGEPWFE